LAATFFLERWIGYGASLLAVWSGWLLVGVIALVITHRRHRDDVEQ
jgi:hypothetical protein